MWIETKLTLSAQSGNAAGPTPAAFCVDLGIRHDYLAARDRTARRHRGLLDFLKISGKLIDGLYPHRRFCGGSERRAL
jgi:hypothetical protein